ncbi:hypothetical protein AYI69_g3013 [Smittium culicis]|uniref:Uncharacterized protein n=1 Tax=Smittium culicis TaxID=133412 RepID=A0A1R1YKX2_9FUNG|nr:hypothetical protein AYI69_g5998 [Smittium culicis]OMJ27548.1 hypothetical protein AYI69_g3013 [Smittium culicis]
MSISTTFDTIDTISSPDDEGNSINCDFDMFQLKDMSVVTNFNSEEYYQQDPYSDSDMDSEDLGSVAARSFISRLEKSTGGVPDVDIPRSSPHFGSRPDSFLCPLKNPSLRPFTRLDNLPLNYPHDPRRSSLRDDPLFSISDAKSLCRSIFPNGIFGRSLESNDESSALQIDSTIRFIFPSFSAPAFVVGSFLFTNFSPISPNYSDFNEYILSLIEFAENTMNCENLIVSLKKSELDGLPQLVRAFMYAGFEIVSPKAFNYNMDYFLLGYDLK